MKSDHTGSLLSRSLNITIAVPGDMSCFSSISRLPNTASPASLHQDTLACDASQPEEDRPV
ncbi:unnamed protein product, partial [Rangifer tarandus platyrhynchus]